jgi:hypothetical protein
MMDRVLMWEMSQIRRRELLETAGVVRRRTAVRPEAPLEAGWWSRQWASLFRHGASAPCLDAAGPVERCDPAALKPC